MDKFLLVFLGGGTGAFARFLVSSWAIERLGLVFPYGTLIVNLVGCFLIGLLAGLPSSLGSLPPATRLLLVTGFLGGFTTFSAYEYESFILVSDGEMARGLMNLGGSVVLGFFAVALGYGITQLALQTLKGRI